MIDIHSLVVAAVDPVKVRPAVAYVDSCMVNTNATHFEVSDIAEIVVSEGNGVGVIVNPGQSCVSLIHLGRALLLGPWKINNLPSACDLIMLNDKEIIIAELTESNPRSVLGIPDSPKPGKMEKAKQQLKSTISYLYKAGTNLEYQKRSAIFFFRIPKPIDTVAAKSLNAFMMRPTLRTVTIYRDTEYPDWEFRNHPYPHPYTLL